MLCIKFEYSLTRNGGIRRPIQDKGFRGRKEKNCPRLPIKLPQITNKTAPDYQYSIKNPYRIRVLEGEKMKTGSFYH